MNLWCGSSPRASGRRRIRSDSATINSSSPEADRGEEYRIIVLGAPGVGKTALCRAFVHGEVGTKEKRRSLVYADDKVMSTYTKWDTVDDEPCHLQILDMNILDTHNILDQQVREHIPRGDGFILFYSITDKKSFYSIPQLYGIRLQSRATRNAPVVLVGNKIDANEDRNVTTTVGRELAFDLGSSFYECSSRLDYSMVTCAFHDVIRQIRCVRAQKRALEQKTNTKMRRMINRLSLKARRKPSQRQSTS